jgi:hypothetical protein
LTSYNDLGQGGLFTGLMDNAGGVAALAVAAPVLAEAGVEAMLAFPDEEEGPVGAGNQTMCRGSARIAGLPAAEARDYRGVSSRAEATRTPTRGEASRTRRGWVAAPFSPNSRASRAAPPRLSASMDWPDAWLM